MKIAFTIGILAIACGCTPLTQQQIEERRYEEVERQDHFLAYKRNCVESGGLLVITPRGGSQLRRSEIPRRSDSFSCTRQVGSFPRG